MSDEPPGKGTIKPMRIGVPVVTAIGAGLCAKANPVAQSIATEIVLKVQQGLQIVIS
jgi:hypothetical protein